MAIDGQNQQSPRLRRGALIFLFVIILLLFGLQFSQAAFNLTFLRPESLQQTFVFAALSALIFLLFVALTFVLARNLIKLFAERRLGVLGSAFRTRMVVGGLVLSFLPVIFMFLFAYGLMNRSIDKWFSRPVEDLRQDSGRVAELLSNYASSNAQAEANALASSVELRRAFARAEYGAVNPELQRYEASLQGGFIFVLHREEVVGSFKAPAPWREMHGAMRSALANSEKAQLLRWDGSQYLVASRPLPPEGEVLVAMPLPQDLSDTLARIESSQRQYYELSQNNKQIRRLYMQLLMLLTVLVLFAASWLSIFISRLVTRPVAALAEATREISEGHLDYRVEVTAADELGDLVRSFNQMAAELENNRRQIEHSRKELAETNVALSDANKAIEQRSREIETILENVPTGVLSLDEDFKVIHSNHGFDKLFSETAKGVALQQLFETNIAGDIERLLRRSDRMGTAAREMEIMTPRGNLTVEVTAASLQSQKQRMGYVVVFEDLSDLLKAQKQSAWREVARRVAHEIKNPLTPIALSAERIRRHLDRIQTGTDDASLAVISGCAETISGAVETVRKLVDEFSTLARFPTTTPQPYSINAIVDAALTMFHGRLEGIRVHTRLATDLPKVLADPEAIKRVVANLVDNAAESMRDAMTREILVQTALVETRDTVEIIVADTGHGVSRELKEKLFLPYFSTKDRGTGLGLAIVSRIVEEHHGSVRVEENQPVGARFVVELPVAPAAHEARETTNA